MNFNPQMIKMMQSLKNSGNPQEALINMIEQSSQNNPMMANILALAKEGKTSDIENIARNMLKEQGLDFDNEFNNFKKVFGFK